MMRRLFGREDRTKLEPLYQAVVEEARQPVWYRNGGVPDTIDGRFDMVAAILTLVLLRLEGAGERGRAPAAHLTELFVHDMDGQLRERGIGDIVVGKHVGRMMGALGGRLGAFRDAFGKGDLDGAIERNIYRGSAVEPVALAATRERLTRLHQALAAISADALLAGQWPR